MISPAQWCLSSRVVRRGAGRKVVDMKKTSLRAYHVIANDPDAEWRCLYIDVRAHSEAEAEDVARKELAKTKRDHFSIELIVEAA